MDASKRSFWNLSRISIISILLTLILGSHPVAGEAIVLPEGQDPGYCHSVAMGGPNHGGVVWVELENRLMWTMPIYSVKIDMYMVETATLCYETGNLQNRDDSFWWDTWGENNTNIMTKDSFIEMNGLDFQIHCFDSSGTEIYQFTGEDRSEVALPSYSICDIIFSGGSIDYVYTIQVLSDIQRPFYHSLWQLLLHTCWIPVILLVLVGLIFPLEDKTDHSSG